MPCGIPLFKKSTQSTKYIEKKIFLKAPNIEFYYLFFFFLYTHTTTCEIDLSAKKYLFKCSDEKESKDPRAKNSSLVLSGGHRSDEAIEMLKTFYKGENPNAPLDKRKPARDWQYVVSKIVIQNGYETCIKLSDTKTSTV